MVSWGVVVAAPPVVPFVGSRLRPFAALIAREWALLAAWQRNWGGFVGHVLDP